MSEEIEEIYSDLCDFATAIESAAVDIKRRISRRVEKTKNVNEQNFSVLKYQAIKGDKLQDFEVCFKSDNPVDVWQRAFNILKVNNATIKNHYSPEGFQYYYWDYLEKYDDRFYRKKKTS
jgi:hypothetical protein